MIINWLRPQNKKMRQEMSQSKFVLLEGTKVLHDRTLVTLLGGGEGEGCWPSMYRMQCLWWKRGSLGYTFPEMTVPQVHR